MNKRKLGNTGGTVSEIGLGTWQLGTKWGEPFDAMEADKILVAAREAGINFIDTADVYNSLNSELAIGHFLEQHPDEFFVTTKCGRKLSPHTSEIYTREAIRGFAEGSLKRIGVEALDLLLLHCPPTAVYEKDEVWKSLKELKAEGKILHYGVSIEKVSEGLTAMKHGVSVIEVIFNMFRMKPLEELFVEAQKNNVGIIVRVPLASGLLTGRYSKETTFGENDHRSYNREGKSFDKGETFSGVDYELGLKAVNELKKLFQTDDLAPIALRWILMFDAVSVVIPGASKEYQVLANVRASELPPLTPEQMAGVKEIYDTFIRPSVHPLW